MTTTMYFLNGKRIGRSAGAAALMVICSCMTLKAQVFQWAEMGGGQGWKRGNAIAVDAQGNSFTAFSLLPCRRINRTRILSAHHQARHSSAMLIARYSGGDTEHPAHSSGPSMNRGIIPPHYRTILRMAVRQFAGDEELSEMLLRVLKSREKRIDAARMMMADAGEEL